MEKAAEINKLALKAFAQSLQTESADVTLAQLLTAKEKVQVGRRILIAQAILAGKTRYEINNHLSVSPNTFAQIRRWLESEFSEYSSAYHNEPKPKDKTSKRVEPLSYDHIKRNFPAHFLLFLLVEELFSIKK